MKFALVVTCLKPPELLLGYAKNFLHYHHKRVMFVIVGDRKTDNEGCGDVKAKLENLGFQAVFLSVEEQQKTLPSKLLEIIPFNSDNRRNLGYFYASMYADQIISIDDDNYVIPDVDYLGWHDLSKGNTYNSFTNESKNIIWYNPCDMLNIQTRVFARGHPLNHRNTLEKPPLIYTRNKKGRPIANLGLWRGAPDVDAFTLLTHPNIVSHGMSSPSDNNLLLGLRIWCPINSQNTCINVKAIPAYYFIEQGFEINGLKLDRYGDIWQGLFLKKCMDAMDDSLSIGNPLTEHLRNAHDYLSDMRKELPGLALTIHLVDWLKDLPLDGVYSYADCYSRIADELEKWPWSDCSGVKTMKDRIVHNMRVWVECISEA